MPEPEPFDFPASMRALHGAPNVFMADSFRTIAYHRVSTGRQDTGNQRLALLEFARKENIRINGFIELSASSRGPARERKLDRLLGAVAPGDLVLVSELSRLGRSIGQIIALLDALAKRSVRFRAVKENIRIDGAQDIPTKVMIALFALFAEIERDFISERTKEGLTKARASGKLLGRPKGSLGRSKLDGREAEIKNYLTKGASKTSVARIVECSPHTLDRFVRSRKLMEKN